MGLIRLLPAESLRASGMKVFEVLRVSKAALLFSDEQSLPAPGREN
jgi:hypothetical protein